MSPCFSATITADHLEYVKEDNIYKAVGSVRIEKDVVVVQADTAVLYQSTSDAELRGHITYEDDRIIATAERVELNLDEETGVLYEAVIYSKKDNYWIRGDAFQKISKNHYYSPVATFTTCNAEPYFTPEAFPATVFQRFPFAESEPESLFANAFIGAKKPDWCFKGENVDMTLGGKLTAKNVVYNLKGLPVLYTPYISAPLDNERQTGFLFPLLGTNSKKGFLFSPAFFWAIDDDRDATVYLDYYSKTGGGGGVEYRQISPLGLNSWLAYFLRDNELKKNFVEVKSEGRYEFGAIKAYTDINYLNDADFYREYGVNPDSRLKRAFQLSQISRFTQSTVELSLPLSNSRAYLLNQYWVDLNLEASHVPQRLPEAGYVVNPTRVGPLVLTMSSSVANFFREKETSGQRLDINPTISYSIGNSVQFFQSLSLRETAYNLVHQEDFGSNPHRETLEYRANVLTRFVKRYESFTHIIEPSLGYQFIPETHALPVFDSTELFDKTSLVQASILNTFQFKNLAFYARLTQPYDVNAEGGAKPWLPTKLELTLISPVTIRYDMSYNFEMRKLDSVNYEIGVPLTDKIFVSLTERHDRENDIMYYAAALTAAVTKKLSVQATASYDGKGRGLRDSLIKAIYTDQCWSVDVSFTRKPGDSVRPAEYSFAVLFGLKGIGKVRAL